MKASPVVCKCCLIWAAMIKATRNARLAVFHPSLLFCSLLLVGLAQPVSAQTLKYVFTGTASGTVGDMSFANATLTVSTIGDTSTVVFTTPINRLNVPPGGSSFSIGGVGSGTFTDATYVFDNQTTFGGSVGFGDPSLPLGFCCDIIQIHDDAFESNNVFATYDLKSPIGPLGFVTDPSLSDWVNVPTSLGNMTVTSYTNVSFTASSPNFVTPPQPVSPGATVTFTDDNIINDVISIPLGTNMGNAAFMEVNFQQWNPTVFNTTRLPATSTNPWSGGTVIPPGTTCTPIAGTGGNCIVMEALCFDSTMTPIMPCQIFAPTGSLITIMSTYQTSATQLNPGLIIADDGKNDWANITTSFTANTIDPLIGGSTQGINTDKAIVNLGTWAICPLYDQTKSVKSGAVVPIKFYLGFPDCSTDVSSATIMAHATSVVPLSTQPPGTLEDAGNANPDFDFRFDSTLGPSGGYIFNLQTTGLSTGTWALNFTVGATSNTSTIGTNYQLQFGVK